MPREPVGAEAETLRLQANVERLSQGLFLRPADGAELRSLATEIRRLREHLAPAGALDQRALMPEAAFFLK